MVENALIIVSFWLFFCVIIIYLLYANKKARDGRDATFAMSEIENEYLAWMRKNKDKDIDIKHPDAQNFLKRRIIALVIFMKTHSIKKCADGFKNSLQDLLENLLDKDAFIKGHKKLLKGVSW